MWVVTEENKSALNLSDAISLTIDKETKRDKWHVRAEYPVTENTYSMQFTTVKYSVKVLNSEKEAADYLKYLYEQLSGKK